MNKRYQVFVSSTFEDLTTERRAVLDAILQTGHFPSGMEYFPASGALPWEIIKKMIDDCDYYVVIIAARYGSIGNDDMSYTENEYDYARTIGKHIIPFLHSSPDELPSKHTESLAKRKKQLTDFRRKIEGNGTTKRWDTPESLRTEVILSLNYAFARHPATGWVRADQADTTKILQKVVSLQERVDALQVENESLIKTIAESSANPEKRFASGEAGQEGLFALA